MTETTTLPDRLSTNPKSPHYDEALLAKGVGIKFDGQEKTNVEEYCVSEGWIRVAVGRTVDRKGNPLTIKLTGKVEPYLQKLEPCVASSNCCRAGRHVSSRSKAGVPSCPAHTAM